MRKSLEAITTVVSTITGITYATERPIGDAGVSHNVIHCYAAGVRFREDCVVNVRHCVNVAYQQARGDETYF